MNRALAVALILALVGAAFDFASGYLIIASTMQPALIGMGMNIESIHTSAYGWGIGISAMGIVLIVTAFLSLTQLGKNKMGTFGILMISYGIIMLILGAAMYQQVTPAMKGAIVSGIGMFVVGALMIFNGAMMQRNRGMM
jgi:hypothetical protein